MEKTKIQVPSDSLADWVRVEIDSKGLSNAKLGKLTGIGTGTIARWRSGEVSEISTDHAELLARYLEIRTEELVSYLENSSPLTIDPLEELRAKIWQLDIHATLDLLLIVAGRIRNDLKTDQSSTSKLNSLLKEAVEQSDRTTVIDWIVTGGCSPDRAAAILDGAPPESPDYNAVALAIRKILKHDINGDGLRES